MRFAMQGQDTSVAGHGGAQKGRFGLWLEVTAAPGQRHLRSIPDRVRPWGWIMGEQRRHGGRNIFSHTLEHFCNIVPLLLLRPRHMPHSPHPRYGST